jgi:Ca2+-binding EF-hand superfamily protein
LEIFFYSKSLFKLEEKLSLDALNEINELFTEYDTDGSGSLELEEFKNVVKRALKIEGRVC